MEFLYGIHPVKIALEERKRIIKQLLVYQSKNLDLTEILKLAEHSRVPIQYSTKYELNRITNNSAHQNVVLECKEIEAQSYKNEFEKEPWIIGLERVMDPHNLGSIIRSCGFYSVPVILDEGCGRLSPVVSKASAGVLEHYWAKGRLGKISSFTKHSFSHPLIASICHKEESTVVHSLPTRGILLIGNEGDGLKKKTFESAQYRYHLPGHINSLNAAVAAGILMDRILNNKIT